MSPSAARCICQGRKVSCPLVFSMGHEHIRPCIWCATSMQSGGRQGQPPSAPTQKCGCLLDKLNSSLSRLAHLLCVRACMHGSMDRAELVIRIQEEESGRPCSRLPHVPDEMTTDCSRRITHQQARSLFIYPESQQSNHRSICVVTTSRLSRLEEVYSHVQVNKG